MNRVLPAILPIVLSLLPGPLGLVAQAPTPELEPGVDPYTRGERTRMRALGIVSFGGFKLGGYHDTRDVDELLGEDAVHWIETAHFKIASTLPAYTLSGDAMQHSKLKLELTELAALLPDAGIDPETRYLDPWLRAHLFARRCEQTYTEFQELLRVSDSDFPRNQAEATRMAVHMGEGPYLGKADKYVVFLAGNAVQYQRYTQEYLGAKWNWPQRQDIGLRRGFFFGTSIDLGGQLRDDTALHACVVYNVAHNLMDGYRGYFHETPVWFKTGLAQSMLRAVDPRYPNYDRPPKGAPDLRNEWQWERVLPRVVRAGKATPMAEMAQWLDWAEFRFEDYVVAWSRVEFLRSRSERAVANFLFTFKDPRRGVAGEVGAKDVVELSLAALNDAAGFDSWEAFDAAWQEWVAEQDAARIGAARSPRRRSSAR